VAYADTETVRNTSQGPIAQIRRLSRALARRASQRAKYNRTVHELNMFNDRDLADLNIARCDIGRIAAQAVYGR